MLYFAKSMKKWRYLNSFLMKNKQKNNGIVLMKGSKHFQFTDHVPIERDILRHLVYSNFNRT